MVPSGCSTTDYNPPMALSISTYLPTSLGLPVTKRTSFLSAINKNIELHQILSAFYIELHQVQNMQGLDASKTSRSARHICQSFNQKVSGIITLNLYLTDPEVRLKFRLVALPKYMFIKSIFNSDEYLGKSKRISLVATIFSAGAAD